MRGPSAWSVADRELTAAYVSKVNESAFCVAAHTATAGQAYPGRREGFKRCWPTWNRPPSRTGSGPRCECSAADPGRKGGAGDMREVLSAGVSRQQVQDALAVCAAFNTTGRLADAFGFELLSPEGFEAGAKYLLKWGYR
ncbi:MAG: hypothetical protein ABSA53_19480 [Streptosporangiaceae bacterium]